MSTVAETNATFAVNNASGTTTYRDWSSRWLANILGANARGVTATSPLASAPLAAGLR